MLDKVAMLDVGDGLCSALIRGNGNNVVIDWGAQGPAQLAAEAWHRMAHVDSSFAPDAFILSHYHSDHYNGLRWAASRPGRFPEWRRVTNVFGPGLPDIPDSRAFYLAYLAMSLRILGATTGLMELDFLLSSFDRLAPSSVVRYHRLFQGESFMIGSYQYECIWPPRSVKGPNVHARISRALNLFRRALDEDSELRDLYFSLDDHIDGVLERFRSTERTNSNVVRQRSMPDLGEVSLNHAKLPQSVTDANKALKGIANELSLGFREGSRLAFFGDIDCSQLGSVVDYLEKSKTTEFGVIIAPHHGTMWDKSLMQLRSDRVMISIGDKLWRNYQKDLRRVGRQVDITRVSGDLVVPL
jgi:hypothetical protein